MNKELARNPISTTRISLQSPQMKFQAELPSFGQGHIFNGVLDNTGHTWAKNVWQLACSDPEISETELNQNIITNFICIY